MANSKSPQQKHGLSQTQQHFAFSNLAAGPTDLKIIEESEQQNPVDKLLDSLKIELAEDKLKAASRPKVTVNADLDITENDACETPRSRDEDPFAAGAGESAQEPLEKHSSLSRSCSPVISPDLSPAGSPTQPARKSEMAPGMRPRIVLGR